MTSPDSTDPSTTDPSSSSSTDPTAAPTDPSTTAAAPTDPSATTDSSTATTDSSSTDAASSDATALAPTASAPAAPAPVVTAGDTAVPAPTPAVPYVVEADLLREAEDVVLPYPDHDSAAAAIAAVFTQGFLVVPSDDGASADYYPLQHIASLSLSPAPDANLPSWMDDTSTQT
jgi:hypothetical protein